MASMIYVYDMDGDIAGETTLESLSAKILRALEKALEDVFSEYDEKKHYPNMITFGSFGTGKTSSHLVIGALVEKANPNWTIDSLDYDCFQVMFQNICVLALNLMDWIML